MGGYQWRRDIAGALDKLQRQRDVLIHIVEGDLSTAELYQLISAAALLNSTAADQIRTLLEYKEKDA